MNASTSIGKSGTYLSTIDIFIIFVAKHIISYIDLFEYFKVSDNLINDTMDKKMQESLKKF